MDEIFADPEGIFIEKPFSDVFDEMIKGVEGEKAFSDLSISAQLEIVSDQLKQSDTIANQVNELLIRLNTIVGKTAQGNRR